MHFELSTVMTQIIDWHQQIVVCVAVSCHFNRQTRMPTMESHFSIILADRKFFGYLLLSLAICFIDQLDISVPK